MWPQKIHRHPSELISIKERSAFWGIWESKQPVLLPRVIWKQKANKSRESEGLELKSGFWIIWPDQDDFHHLSWPLLPSLKNCNSIFLGIEGISHANSNNEKTTNSNYVWAYFLSAYSISLGSRGGTFFFNTNIMQAPLEFALGNCKHLFVSWCCFSHVIYSGLSP